MDVSFECLQTVAILGEVREHRLLRALGVSTGLLAFFTSEVGPLNHLVLVTFDEVDRHLISPKNSCVDFILNNREPFLDVV